MFLFPDMAELEVPGKLREVGVMCALIWITALCFPLYNTIVDFSKFFSFLLFQFDNCDFQAFTSLFLWSNFSLFWTFTQESYTRGSTKHLIRRWQNCRNLQLSNQKYLQKIRQVHLQLQLQNLRLLLQYSKTWDRQKHVTLYFQKQSCNTGRPYAFIHLLNICRWWRWEQSNRLIVNFAFEGPFLLVVSLLKSSGKLN